MRSTLHTLQISDTLNCFYISYGLSHHPLSLNSNGPSHDHPKTPKGKREDNRDWICMIVSHRKIITAQVFEWEVWDQWQNLKSPNCQSE